MDPQDLIPGKLYHVVATPKMPMHWQAIPFDEFILLYVEKGPTAIVDISKKMTESEFIERDVFVFLSNESLAQLDERFVTDFVWPLTKKTKHESP